MPKSRHVAPHHAPVHRAKKADAGASPDAPIVKNKQGGLQSAVEGRYDLIPGEALIRIARVVGEGAARYSKNNWRKIDMASHVNHALMHLAAFLSDDASDDHLGHGLTRLAMAVAVEDSEYRFTEVED